MSLPKLGAGSEGIILRGRKRKLRGGFCFSDPTDLRTSLLFFLTTEIRPGQTRCAHVPL